MMIPALESSRGQEDQDQFYDLKQKLLELKREEKLRCFLKDGKLHSLKEIITRASLRDSFDGGLMAEWLVTMHLVDNGLAADTAAQVFCSKVDVVTMGDCPEWWEKKIAFELGGQEPEAIEFSSVSGATKILSAGLEELGIAGRKIEIEKRKVRYQPMIFVAREKAVALLSCTDGNAIKGDIRIFAESETSIGVHDLVPLDPNSDIGYHHGVFATIKLLPDRLIIYGEHNTRLFVTAFTFDAKRLVHFSSFFSLSEGLLFIDSGKIPPPPNFGQG